MKPPSHPQQLYWPVFGVLAVTLVMSPASDHTDASAPGTKNYPMTDYGRREFERVSNQLATLSSKKKMVVAEATVSVNGVMRPDLGAAFSDTLVARLMAEESYDIIDASALGTNDPGAIALKNTNLERTGEPLAGPESPFDFGKTAGADFIAITTVVCTATEIRLSVRKLRLPSGKVERIVQERRISGDPNMIFGLAESVALQLAPPKPVEAPKPVEPGYTYVRMWINDPPATPKSKLKPDPLALQILSAPKALKSGANSLTTKTPVPLGQIASVDAQWNFCQFTCKPGELKLQDTVFVWAGADKSDLITMKVSRIDGTRAVAEFDAQAAAGTIAPGTTVHTWRPMDR